MHRCRTCDPGRTAGRLSTLEEQRIGRMYLNLITRKLTKAWDAVFGSTLRRSSLLPIAVVVLALLIPGLIYLAHRHAKFHELETRIQGDTSTIPVAAGPGGRQPVLLTRAESLGGSMPEFHTATFLPGVGLSLLQITAFLPHRGEVPLLVAPTIQQVQDGTSPKLSGPDDTHGALEVPWSGGLVGIPSPVGMTIAALWHGHSITLPTDPQGVPTVAEAGMLRTQDTDSAAVHATNEGQLLTARFAASDFDGHWLSRTETSVSALLTPTALELTVNATNVGEQPEPVGIGWHPRFSLPSGDRNTTLLRLPAGEVLALGDSTRSIPNGKIIAAPAELSRYMGHAQALGSQSFDTMLVGLKPAGMDSMTSAELRDPAAGFGLRISAVSASIKELRVYAPSGEDFVGLGLQTNYDNPLAGTWPSDDQAIATLMPGQTLEWKIKVEIFPVFNKSATP